jgi:hypothetical protein
MSRILEVYLAMGLAYSKLRTRHEVVERLPLSFNRL